MGKFNLQKIQSILSNTSIDGWLLYDFRGSNDLALNILDISSSSHLTRRFFYFIPKVGTPTKIVNAIESHNLNHLPGETLLFASHNSLYQHLDSVLKNVNSIAMEYSPFNSIPYLSKVDAGMIELIRTFNVNIISSADLITQLDAVWTKEQYDEYIPVANALTEIVYLSFDFIKQNINKNITEYDVQQFIMNEFDKRKFFTDHPPIVGVNENSANPHYAPTKEINKPINENDFVLIDLWAKQNKENAVWADITWVGYVGVEVPEKYLNIFDIVKNARDSAFIFVKQRFKEGKEVRGYEVDDACRKVITDAGYDKFFIHRTGHSITTTLHGSGPHLDNFETKDERLIIPSTSFSIEPGIYLTGDFGVRSEIDVFIHSDGRVEQTGGEMQNEVIAIMR